MGAAGGRLLYIGQSGNLRARLASYKNLNPDRAPRRLVRLVHEVSSITWEVCESPVAAQLRENQLLRLHRPKFNVVNTWPEQYAFLGVRHQGSTLTVRLVSSMQPEPGETLYGAFKSRGGVRVACGSLLRLLWSLDQPEASPHGLPSALVTPEPPARLELVLGEMASELVAGGLHEFLLGDEDGWLAALAARLPDRERAGPFRARWWEHDLECLREFQRVGPGRHRALRRHAGVEANLIPQEELDDLLVLLRQSQVEDGGGPPARRRLAPSDQGSITVLGRADSREGVGP
jgi:hypothetical protein